MEDGKRTYRMAVEAANDPNGPYPHLAGHANVALPFIARVVRILDDPQFAHPQSQEYFKKIIRETADDYTFATEFIKATRFYQLNRSLWTDEEAERIGRDFLRGYHDMIPPQSEDVPF